MAPAADPLQGEASAGRPRVAALLREQAGWCASLGSPLYADLLDRTADDAEASGPAWSLLEPHADDPRASFLALRLLGAVHRLVLSGSAPDLASQYPSVGGRPGDPWPAFRAVLADRGDDLRPLLRRPVQTNEVGRSAALLGGFLEVARAVRAPLRLLEIGASAGLNLRWDRYRYEWAGGAWGDPASPVRFRNAFTDAAPVDAEVRIAERAGCDRAPVDPTDGDGRLTLLSFVWADMVERVERLRAALDLAPSAPVRLDRADALTWLGDRLAGQRDGEATVVFHSAVTVYFDDDERARLAALLEEAGSRATPSAQLAHLAFEARPSATFSVTLRSWPGGEERLLATAPAHGLPVSWVAG